MSAALAGSPLVAQDAPKIPEHGGTLVQIERSENEVASVTGTIYESDWHGRGRRDLRFAGRKREESGSRSLRMAGVIRVLSASSRRVRRNDPVPRVQALLQEIDPGIEADGAVGCHSRYRGNTDGSNGGGRAFTSAG